MSDTSTLFEMLATEHRRRILLLLCQTESLQVPESFRPRGQGDSQQFQPDQFSRGAGRRDSQKLTIELIHNHLPKLEGEGFIEWDRETQTVSKGPRFPQVEPALTVLLSHAEKFPADLL